MNENQNMDESRASTEDTIDEKSDMQAAAKSEWMDNYGGERPRRASITREYSPVEDPKKSIKRSWTISTPDNDAVPPARNGSSYIPGAYLKGPEQGSYPSLVRTQPMAGQKTYNSEEVVYENPTSPRRILRQSTLPNPEVVYQNLMIPVSPKQSRSPLYSPYLTDNENETDESPTRYNPGIRRQSTLPEPPNLLNVQQKYYGGASPSRSYSRSPERPFVRQQTFPSQATPESVLLHIPRQLPTSPNRYGTGYPKSPDSGNESDHGYHVKPPPARMQRQATLPNPDHQLKVLPTSPPRQLSPGYRKVSPEFVRQNTVPSHPVVDPPLVGPPIVATGSANSLSVHQPHNKFLPISPRAKQSFMFPTAVAPTPRPFLSQQDVINADTPIDAQYDLQKEKHTKMGQNKRSFSNEEPSVNRPLPPPTEGRRMLPEIPQNRSPNKLVRQSHVKEELIRTNSSQEKRSPIFKTFAEANQSNPMLNSDYPPATALVHGLNTITTQAVISNIPAASGASGTYYIDNLNYVDGLADVPGDAVVGAAGAPPNYLINEVEQGQQTLINQTYDENYGDFYQQAIPNRGRGGRRKSRELPEPPVKPIPKPIEIENIVAESSKKKVEAVRSISEDTGVITPRTASTRRSLSHPEKEASPKIEVTQEVPASAAPTTAPKLTFAEILAAKKKSQPSRRKTASNLDTSVSPNKPHNQVLEKQDSSKSFDAVIKKVIMNERLNKIDSQDENKSQSMDERMFVDNNIRKASGVINESDVASAVFKKISASSEKTLKKDDIDDARKTTTSTLGEAEIQSAVEAAAVLFKKVVLQKRKATAKKLAEEGDRKFEYWANNDDYKLVFISSDSSSSREDDTSSLDECDWDYFEPSMKRDFSPPTRRGTSESPPHPVSDTDDERLSDSFLYRRSTSDRRCIRRASSCNCSSKTIFVPIIVPVSSQQEEHEVSRAIQQQLQQYSINGWPASAAAALISKQQQQQPQQTAGTDYGGSGEHVTLSSVSVEKAVVVREQQKHQAFRNSNDVDANVQRMESLISTGLTVEQSALIIAAMSDDSVVGSDKSSASASADVAEHLRDTSDNGSSKDSENICEAPQPSMISVGKIKSGDPKGYLASESVFSSDSASDAESETSVNRSYDVFGAAQTDEIASTGDEMEYSDEIDTDSDDTGTVADRKRFTRVFVVNRGNASSSSSEDITSSSDSSTSSDNDTDVEGDGDGVVVLNYVKNIDDLEETEVENAGSETIVLNYVKPLADGDESLSESQSLQQFLRLEKEIMASDDSSSGNVDESLMESPENSSGEVKESLMENPENTKRVLKSCLKSPGKYGRDELSVKVCEENPEKPEEICSENSVFPEEEVTDGETEKLEKVEKVENSEKLRENQESVENSDKIMIFEGERTDETSLFDSMIPVEIDSLPFYEEKPEQGENFESHLEISEENSESYLDNTASCLDLDIPLSNTSNESEEVDLHARSENVENAREEEEAAADGDADDISDDSLIVNDKNTSNDRCETSFAAPPQSHSDNAAVAADDVEFSGSGDHPGEKHSGELSGRTYEAERQKETQTLHSEEIEPSSGKDVFRFGGVHKSFSNKYTSLVMITQASVPSSVSIVTTDTTKLVTDNVTVRHTNFWGIEPPSASDNEGNLDDEIEVDEEMMKMMNVKSETKAESGDCIKSSESVTVVTGGSTLSCLEDGLADDDSWVEEQSQDEEEEFASVTDSDSCEEFLVDREEELRGYNRTSIDFTLHTIVEESCEESEVETPKRMSASELEKYFFFGLGDPGSAVPSITVAKNDSPSESSSVCSEGPAEEPSLTSVDLASSRLEKYFLSGFMGFEPSDESVGSDSEGEPSPERRKKLVRARGSGRSQSNSLDNLLATSKETEETFQEPPLPPPEEFCESTRKSQSRDSGFIGSNDDLLKDDVKSPELKLELPEIEEEAKADEPEPLQRKDSFNNWSSDEETNLMMSKMRQFFKTLVAASANAQIASRTTPPMVEAFKKKPKPPQLVYFESELTRLMKTVPGIRDDQVREIVEYLSSEDTWSDSYESSDYTSSDVESKTELQEQISASCQQIIKKFDCAEDEEGDMGDGGLLVDETGINKETAFVYQKLVASLSKISAGGEEKPITDSPPLIAKVINHIGSRLVALMHEVSSGESLASSSPRSNNRYHRKLQQKISTTTTEDEDETSDHDFTLPRSKSHDLLLSDKPRSSTSDMGEEKESDYERFSWRGSFESALLAPNDSRTKLTNIESAPSPASVLAAKRRSAGDLLFNASKSLSREQLDRVRSCGSIGGDEADKLWPAKQQRRRSANCDTDESSDDTDRLAGRSTLPRSLVNAQPASTNSLPRLSSGVVSQQPGSSGGGMQKSQSVHQILQNNVKSARYRAPGFRPQAAGVAAAPPKRAMSAPGLQPIYMRRDRRKIQVLEEANAAEANVSPTAGARSPAALSSVAASPAAQSPGSATSDPYPSQSDEDIDRLVAMHQNRQNSLSSLGVRSDSMASVYSGAGEGRYGTVTVRGQVEFGMQYNYKHSALEILVKQCRDLAAVDSKRNRSDPYVKLYLLPDKSKTGKRKTKVKKHTLNPVFDETLRFYMSLSSLESRTLWLTVWHSDMFGRNDFLGEVLMPLQGKVFDNPQPQWYNLQERSEPFDDLPVYKGDIIVGLKFIPPESGTSTPHSTPKGGSLNLRKFSVKSTSSSGATSSSRSGKGALHILVKEAKNLSAIKASGTCDAFCKSYLLPDKNRSSKQKTSVAKRSTNPVWNHTFVYEDVSLQDLSERALELTIWDHDRLASNEFLGGVRFSMGAGKVNGRAVDWMDATGKELSLWQSMLNRPNFWVEGCLTLRSSLDNARVAT